MSPCFLGVVFSWCSWPRFWSSLAPDGGFVDHNQFFFDRVEEAACPGSGWVVGAICYTPPLGSLTRFAFSFVFFGVFFGGVWVPPS